MKLILTILIILGVICANKLLSQDIINLSNGVTIYGEITEINGQTIKFVNVGGQVTMDQVKSYHQHGKAEVINNNVNSITSSPQTTVPDCEKNNTGEAVFESTYSDPVQVIIYAIGTSPYSSQNPQINQITVPAHGTITVYEIPTGIHFYDYSGGFVKGQLNITKCNTYKVILKN